MSEDTRFPGRAKTVASGGSGDQTLITEATTLQPGQNSVEVTIPLLTADDFAITLPPVGACAGELFFIHGIRASGTYSSGAVTVQDQDDNLNTDIASDPITTSADYVAVRNYDGKLWVIETEKTT